VLNYEVSQVPSHRAASRPRYGLIFTERFQLVSSSVKLLLTLLWGFIAWHTILPDSPKDGPPPPPPLSSLAGIHTVLHAVQCLDYMLGLYIFICLSSNDHNSQTY